MLRSHGVAPTILVLVLSACSLAVANGGGITGRSGLQFDTCNTCSAPGCHGGGNFDAMASITGDLQLLVNQTRSYTFVLSADGASEAGFNVAIEQGTLSSTDNDVQVLATTTGCIPDDLLELTQVAPQPFAVGSATWDFQWTAPAVAGSYTMFGAGNAADDDGGTPGDDIVNTTVAIEVFDAPVASFDAEPASGQQPLSVDFTNTSSGGIPALSFDWDFGDATSSTEENPTHTYTSDGVFTVTLTITDDGGNTASATTTITVDPAPPVVAQFTADPLSGTAPLTVDFNNQSSGGVPLLTFAWDFGDGDSSSEESPSHTYVTDGTFLVVLTVMDSIGQTGTATETIVVDPAPLEPFFVRGDANSDGAIDVSDVVFLARALFGVGDPLVCEDAGDIDDSDILEPLTDTFALLMYLFQGGPPPAQPFPDCGIDPSADALVCIDTCP